MTRVSTLPRVAVVGYPNVGKSTLFNRLTGTRDAVVAPESGVTRDRKEGRAEWVGRWFTVVDTGGIDLQGEEPLSDQVRGQARLAIAEAAVVVFVVDGKVDIGPQEHEIADLLRRSRVPVVLAVNKIDTRLAEEKLHDFWQLGLGEPTGVSAEHGLGIGDLLDAVVRALPLQEGEQEEDGSAVVDVAIVGRPNVGKSSLVNALLGDERVIVSPIPGTTRDAIDTLIEYRGRHVNLVDTAGLRRKGRRTTTDVEYYSTLRTIKALERSDVALVVVDASEGLVDLDLQVAYEAQRAACATAILFNKWDITTTDLQTATARIYGKVQMRPPWLTVSAVTGRKLGEVLPLALDLYERYSARIPTADLNRWLEEIKGRRDPPQKAGKSLKLFYIVQYDHSPLRFKVQVNARALLTRSYAYFFENRLRDAYGLWGVPLVIDFEGKEERYS
ncbi:MAG: ribosome biogenesis GTPase Der [Thermoleophilia bacterium]|nr:ribosome biogenesis GTPase Der [Thermoleophilia bacterium]